MSAKVAKRGPKVVAPPKRRANADAYEQLPDNPTAADFKDAEVNVSLAELEDRVADVRDSWETDSLFEDAFEDLTADSRVDFGGE
jgi:NAD-dependent histone deacetylase SIR2